MPTDVIEPDAPPDSVAPPPPPVVAPQPADRGTTCAAAALELIRGASEPAPLPRAWDFLKPSSNLLRLGTPPGLVAEELQRQFSSDDLLRARILLAAADGSVGLNPAFGDGASVFALIRKDNELCDVMSARGSLRSRLPSVEFAAAVNSDDDNQPAQNALLVASDSDAVVLAALGIRFFWAHGLENVSAERVKRLFPKDTEAQCRQRFWTLVGFTLDPLSHEPPPLFKRILYNMRVLQDHCHCDFGSLAKVWQPKFEHIDELRTAVNYRNPIAIVNLVRHSIKTQKVKLADYQPLRKPDPNLRLAETAANLRRALQQSKWLPFRQGAREALSLYEDEYRASVLSRFDDEAASAPDALEAMLFYQARELSEFWFQSQPIVDKARRAVKGETTDDGAEFGAADLDQRLRLSDQLLKLHRAISRNK
jgi:hypothetical protein